MANVSNASLNGIYERLSTAPSYHPFEAKTFADWSVEAGDIARVSRGEDTYESPVQNVKLVWKGQPQTVINSTGKRERDPISKLSRKKYGRGGSAVRQSERIFKDFTSEDGYLYSALEMTSSILWTGFEDNLNSLRSYFEITASNLYTHFTDEVSQLDGEIQVTARSLHTEFTSGISSVRSSIDEQADRIGLVVEGTGENAKIKAAQIAASINDGESNAYIGADHIHLDGNTLLSGWLKIDNGNLKVDGNEIVNGNLTMASNTEIRGWDVYVARNLNFSGSSQQTSYSLDNSSVGGLIKSSAITGNNLLTLTHINGQTTTVYKNDETNTLVFTAPGGTITFSKAAPGTGKVNGSWGGATLSVAESATGYDTFTTTISTDLLDENNGGTHYYYLTAYHLDNDAQQPTEIAGARKQYTIGPHPSIANRICILNAPGGGFMNGTAYYDIPAPTVSGWNLTNFTAPYTYNATVSVNGTAYTSGALNATDAYDGGWTQGLSGVELSPSSLNPQFGSTYTVKAKAYMSRSAQAKTDISGASLTFTVPSVTVSDWDLTDYTAPYSYKATVKVGGTTYTSGTLNVPEAYSAGWTGCYNGVGLNSTAATTLSYGQSITVYAQAYQSSSATAKTNVASRKITAPADERQTYFESGRDSVAPFVCTTKTANWDNRTWTITANTSSSKKYYLQARGKTYGGGYGPYLSNDFTQRELVINVPTGGSSVTASNIQLYANGAGEIHRYTSPPGGTSLTSLATILKQAYQNIQGLGTYVRFPATITGASGTKWYYINMAP